MLVNSCALVTSPTDFLTSQTAGQCQLTLALHLRGLLVSLGRIRVAGLGR
jgi:hypothetical protein